MEKKKNIIAIVAVIALVAMLGVCLVACNRGDYAERLEFYGFEVKNYDVEATVQGKMEWSLQAQRSDTHVFLIKFKKTSEAKDYQKYLKSSPQVKVSDYECARSGKLVYWGDPDAVDSVRFLWG